MVLFFNDAQPTHSIIVPFCMLKLKSLQEGNWSNWGNWGRAKLTISLLQRATAPNVADLF
jgi:hypothetical protein